jgi:hypothetical protein
MQLIGQFSAETRVYNPRTLVKNRDNGAGKPQNRDRTPKKIYFSYGKNPVSVKFSNILTVTENSFIFSR